MNVGEVVLGRSYARLHPQERQSHHTSRESLHSTAPAFPPDRVRRAGQEERYGTVRQRLWSWTLFVSMLFCHYADSLGDICKGLGCCLGKLAHHASPRPRISPLSRRSTSTDPQVVRGSVLDRSTGPATKKDWGGARRSSVSRTSCSALPRLDHPFRCAWSYFRGPSLPAPRAGSRLTFFLLPRIGFRAGAIGWT
jgi:hypothetical protein